MGVFENDKLLFALNIAIGIQKHAKIIQDDLWSLFIMGKGPNEKK